MTSSLEGEALPAYSKVKKNIKVCHDLFNHLQQFSSIYFAHAHLKMFILMKNLT